MTDEIKQKRRKRKHEDDSFVSKKKKSKIVHEDHIQEKRMECNEIVNPSGILLSAKKKKRSKHHVSFNLDKNISKIISSSSMDDSYETQQAEKKKKKKKKRKENEQPDDENESELEEKKKKSKKHKKSKHIEIENEVCSNFVENECDNINNGYVKKKHKKAKKSKIEHDDVITEANENYDNCVNEYTALKKKRKKSKLAAIENEANNNRVTQDNDSNNATPKKKRKKDKKKEYCIVNDVKTELDMTSDYNVLGTVSIANSQDTLDKAIDSSDRTENDVLPIETSTPARHNVMGSDDISLNDVSLVNVSPISDPLFSQISNIMGETLTLPVDDNEADSLPDTSLTYAEKASQRDERGRLTTKRMANFPAIQYDFSHLDYCCDYVKQLDYEETPTQQVLHQMKLPKVKPDNARELANEGIPVNCGNWSKAECHRLKCNFKAFVEAHKDKIDFDDQFLFHLPRTLTRQEKRSIKRFRDEHGFMKNLGTDSNSRQ